MRRCPRLTVWLLLVTLSLAPLSVSAYVRATNETGTPVYWRSPCLVLTLDMDTVPSSLGREKAVAAGRLAAAAWTSDLQCTDLSIDLREGSKLSVGLEGQNRLVFQSDAWCDSPEGEEPASCYAPNALAVTTVWKSKTTGEIADADIELNAVAFQWADLVEQPELAAAGFADYQNVLTHELGHLVGLEHPCRSSRRAPPLNDDAGNPQLDCTAVELPISVIESTMYPSAPPSDTTRRRLAQDDVRAVCEIYPAGAAVCHSASGCSMAGPDPARSAVQTVDRSRVYAAILLCLVAALLGYLGRPITTASRRNKSPRPEQSRSTDRRP